MIRKAISTSLLFGFILTMVLSCSDQEEIGPETPPNWKENYPIIKVGTNSVDIKLATDKAATIYYVLQSRENSDAVPDSIKNLALNGSSDLAGFGVTNINASDQVNLVQIDQLIPAQKYYLYIVAESKHNTPYLQNREQMLAADLVMHPIQTVVEFDAEFYGNKQRYLLYMPEEAYKDDVLEFPLMVFLHGLGEKGNDINKVKRNGPPKLVEKGQTFPFIIISPQTPEGIWKTEFIDEVVEHARENLAQISDKLYMTGLSLGGGGTWYYALNYPDKVSAIAPIAGWGNLKRACEIKHLPIWAFHGTDDQVVATANSVNMVNAVNDCGGKAILTLYDGVGHNSWSRAYSPDNELHDPNLFEWFLLH
ncbi:MAG: dienelactone hydrolase family protein [Candidatus Cyclobacteriaceae bacterium M3_2C_046]